MCSSGKGLGMRLEKIGSSINKMEKEQGVKNGVKIVKGNIHHPHILILLATQHRMNEGETLLCPVPPISHS